MKPVHAAVHSAIHAADDGCATGYSGDPGSGTDASAAPGAWLNMSWDRLDLRASPDCKCEFEYHLLPVEGEKAPCRYSCRCRYYMYFKIQTHML